MYRNSRLILVDTPGFDNEEARDRSVIAKIKIWLHKSFPAGKPRGGVIYMRDSKTPASGTSTLWESQIVSSLKSVMRSELCFVVTKAEEFPEQRRTEVQEWLSHRWGSLMPHPPEVYRTEAQNHIRVCAGGQGTPLECDHNVWAPVEYLLGRSEKQILYNDVVLLVTGLTGSGKSTFVNGLWKEPSRRQMRVGESDSLLPCTMQLDYVIIDLQKTPGYNKDYRLVLVDTPGFGNPDKPLNRILNEVFPRRQVSRRHRLPPRCNPGSVPTGPRDSTFRSISSKGGPEPSCRDH
ncbi:hypothetical protein FA13DRAFT_1746232 [Coprinellus micaceus]|uniref:Uncharacterized protein n=1 Tax=Coprinellus micaceus TaxID=71717 RepID=A0A4Y7SBR7_COPMI|nr:hypothetical protein FA13DRAFT_1746232 [Coprinellus micaceus]